MFSLVSYIVTSMIAAFIEENNGIHYQLIT